MLNTATTFLALLQEDDMDIKSIAIDKLELLVDNNWVEISDNIKILEDLYKNRQCDREKSIALILSKLYYNLEDYEYAIEWALESSTKFNYLDKNQYVSTILKKIIDKYINTKKHNFYNKEEPKFLDPRIENIINNIFTTCINNREFNQAIGIAIESFNIEKVVFKFNH